MKNNWDYSSFIHLKVTGIVLVDHCMRLGVLLMSNFFFLFPGVLTRSDGDAEEPFTSLRDKCKHQD